MFYGAHWEPITGNISGVACVDNLPNIILLSLSFSKLVGLNCFFND